jgi:NAD(P)-dependent dehydrogenase (short-subunit alcohol dehydrogenase family)
LKHSIAAITAAISGLGDAAAHTRAEEVWPEIIVTGRKLAQVQEKAARLAAETTTHVFTPPGLDEPSSVRPALTPLAPPLPSGMAVHTMSHRAATTTKAAQNAGPAVKCLMVPLVSLIPGMNQTPETGARR